MSDNINEEECMELMERRIQDFRRRIDDEFGEELGPNGELIPASFIYAVFDVLCNSAQGFADEGAWLQYLEEMLQEVSGQMLMLRGKLEQPH